MLNDLRGAGVDAVGFSMNRILESSFSAGQARVRGALGGEPLGAEARAAGNQRNSSDPGWREPPDGQFGTRKAPDRSGGQVSGGSTAGMLAGVPTWMIWAGVALIVLVGARAFLPRRKG